MGGGPGSATCESEGPCLISVVGAGAQKIHPVFSIDLLRDDGPRLRPLHIPVPFVRGHDYTLAFPMNEVFGSRQAELRVLFVVARVGQIVSVTELNQARILDAAVFLIFLGG